MKMGGIFGNANVGTAMPMLSFDRTVRNIRRFGPGVRDWRKSAGKGAMPVPGGGEKERARRRAQIARGQITEGNGLVRE